MYLAQCFLLYSKSEDILQLSMIHCDFEGADASLQAYSVMGYGDWTKHECDGVIVYINKVSFCPEGI